MSCPQSWLSYYACALADRKSHNNNPKKKKNIRSAWRPVSGSKSREWTSLVLRGRIS